MQFCLYAYEVFRRTQIEMLQEKCLIQCHALCNIFFLSVNELWIDTQRHKDYELPFRRLGIFLMVLLEVTCGHQGYILWSK